jgi:hypothetical protein
MRRFPERDVKQNPPVVSISTRRCDLFETAGLNIGRGSFAGVHPPLKQDLLRRRDTYSF